MSAGNAEDGESAREVGRGDERVERGAAWEGSQVDGWREQELARL